MAILNMISNILRFKKDFVNQETEEPDNPLEQIDQGLEKTDKIIQILEEAIEEGRASITEALTAKQHLEAERAKAAKSSKDWQDRAERAIAVGREEIARDALSHKQECDKTVENYQLQWEAQQAIATQLESQLKLLIRKHADTVRNRGMLHARRQAVAVQQKMNQALLTGDEGAGVTNQIDQIFQDLEAQNIAETEIATQGFENQFAHLETESSIDDELAAIKQQYDASAKKEVAEKPVKTTDKPSDQALSPPETHWFDDDPVSSETSPSKTLDDYWFSEEPSRPQKKVQADYWFPEESEKLVAKDWQPNERTLQAGANVSLSKRIPDLKQIALTIGKKLVSNAQQLQFQSGIALITNQGKVRSQKDFICNRNRQSPCGSVIYRGERFINDDHQPSFSINLAGVPAEIVRLVIVTAIFQASIHTQTFQHIASMWIRLLNEENQEEITSYTYNERGLETVLILGEIYRYKNEWKFKALGQGFETGINALVKTYGVYLS